ncbi:MAG: aldehyde dehydrogenase family protein, partial [Gammaproteobacteria bacterium]|nr:aldehyde dehydrogenase family protein [Gammaproteobacteria bacterium]
DSGDLESLRIRYNQLDGLTRFLNECKDEIKEALFKDLGKPGLEAFTSEIALVAKEIREIRSNLTTWAGKRKVTTFFALQPASSYVQAEALGVVLIIAPWNYPIQLSLMPLVGALAAGNCVVLKPSELAEHTSQLLTSKLPKYLDYRYFRVVQGGVPETTELLKQKFNHIFFTGSAKVGDIVKEAALKSGATYTLELGGKSPCIVDRNVDLQYAAKNILWGKFSNAGQICIAPDYVMVHQDVEKALLDEMKIVLEQFYGKDPSKSHDYGRIINRMNHQRIIGLMQSSGEIFVGGQADEDERYIAPTILTKVSRDSKIMENNNEIFGPVLPVLPMENIKDGIDFIKKDRDLPLTIYLFSNDNISKEYVRKNTRSGSLSVNATLVQASVLTLPFGGIGRSGTGKYHGKNTFDTFSHEKAVFEKRRCPCVDLSALLTYPPFTNSAIKERILRKVL